jgi:hypothetical protein
MCSLFSNFAHTLSSLLWSILRFFSLRLSAYNVPHYNHKEDKQHGLRLQVPDLPQPQRGIADARAGTITGPAQFRSQKRVADAALQEPMLFRGTSRRVNFQKIRGETPCGGPPLFRFRIAFHNPGYFLLFLPQLAAAQDCRTLCPPTDPTASGAKPFGGGLLLADNC